MKKYIGWIPCVAGKLYFKHMQCGLASKSTAITINHIESGLPKGEIKPDKESGLFHYDRYVCISSCYDWKDGTEGDGEFRVVVVGTATNNSGIDGCAYVIPKIVGKENEKWKKIIEEIEKLEGEVVKAKRKKYDISIKEKYADICQRLNDFEDVEYYKVLYEIDRYGFATFDYNGGDRGHLHAFTVVRQIFYYLKYSIHVHQHHNEGEDSLTTVHVVPENIENIGEQLLDDLKESMVAMKRENIVTGYHRLFDNKGVNCYAKSLVESCKRKGYIGKDDYIDQMNYLNNVYGSMETTAEKTEREINIALSASNSARSTVLLLFAIFAPFVLIHLENIRKILPNSDDNGYLSSKLLSFIADVASSEAGLVWVAILLVSIFAFFRIEKMKYGSFMLNIKVVSILFSRVKDDWREGYVIAGIIISLGVALFAAAFVFF